MIPVSLRVIIGNTWHTIPTKLRPSSFAERYSIAPVFAPNTMGTENWHLTTSY